MWLNDERKTAMERYLTVRQEFPYEFQFTWESEGGKSSDQTSKELREWLTENSGHENWTTDTDGIGYSSFILIKDPDLATQFKLRWSDEYEAYTNHSLRGESEA